MNHDVQPCPPPNDNHPRIINTTKSTGRPCPYYGTMDSTHDTPLLDPSPSSPQSQSLEEIAPVEASDDGNDVIGVADNGINHSIHVHHAPYSAQTPHTHHSRPMAQASPTPRTHAPNTPHHPQSTPPLKTWSLAILVFYTVSGGPFGIEPTIRASGNFYSILGFLIFPLIWSIPEALVTAELGSAFRHAGGGVVWVEEAFGDGRFGEELGIMCGYLSWISGATDNAIYPILFLEYLGSVLGWDDGSGELGEEEPFLTGWVRFAYVAAITLALALLNYRGLDIVGNASLLVCIIAMSPFILMVIMGASKIKPSRWLQMPETNQNTYDGSDASSSDGLFDDAFETSPGPLPAVTLGGILWRPFLNNMFWNLNSFDSAASFAAETPCIRTAYPRGIFVGLAMTIVCYIFPLMVAIGATDYHQSEWEDGHLGAVAMDIGGPWLGAWTVLASGISNLGMFEAEMSSDAFMLMGMAQRGYLPECLKHRSRYGTPTGGIIVGTVVIIMFGWAEFGQLLQLLNANYAVALLMEYAAFVKLRLYNSEMERPYRIPIPNWAAVLLVTPPTIGIIALFLVSNWYVYVFVAGSIAVGYILIKCRTRWGPRSDSSMGNHADVPLLEDNVGSFSPRSRDDEASFSSLAIS